MTEIEDLLHAGREALARGDWVCARTVFARAVELERTPEALLGLGTARWWLGEIREAIADWEAAYAKFIRRPDPAEAVGVAVTLSLTQQANFGNLAVSAGWAARAERVAGPLGVPTLDAWVLLARAASCGDPAQVERWAQQACDTARETGDLDLELCALSTKGSALVDAGRVKEGAAMLDEALTGALGGEVESLDTVVYAACLLMQSCVRGADFPLVLHWSHGLGAFTERYGCPYLFATCRAHYGAVLVATGDWVRADAELHSALDLAGDALPAVRAEACAFLAELRLAQGRADEARGIVIEFEEHPVVLPVLAASWLVSGQVELAVSAVHRRLGVPGTRVIEEARLREVLGDARLARGDTDGAAAEARHLLQFGEQAGGTTVARGARLLGRAIGASDPAAARRHLVAARLGFAAMEMPLEVARCRFALAEAVRADEPEAAVAEARAAFATFDGLGARQDADRAAAWLRAAGAPATPAGPRGFAVLTRREGQIVGLVGAGLSNPEIAARLYISRRTVEHHVASVLSKLGLRNRTEVATFAATHDEHGPIPRNR